MDATVQNPAGLATNAVADELPAKAAAEPPVPESDRAPTRFRKARCAARAGLAVALGFVGVLVVEFFLTDPRRGAMTPHDVELFLDRVRVVLAPTARRIRPHGSAILSDPQPPKSTGTRLIRFDRD